eukprot:1179183-Prorocentrum_minimum.AAC.2
MPAAYQQRLPLPALIVRHRRQRAPAALGAGAHVVLYCPARLRTLGAQLLAHRRQPPGITSTTRPSALSWRISVSDVARFSGPSPHGGARPAGCAQVGQSGYVTWCKSQQTAHAFNHARGNPPACAGATSDSCSTDLGSSACTTLLTTRVHSREPTLLKHNCYYARVLC